MKKLSLLFLFIFCSCTTIKQLSSQKITTKIACSDNDFKEKMIYLKAKIDGKVENFLFDTGATMSVITDSTAITGMESKKFGNFGTVTGADNKTTDLKTFTAEFESEFFFSTNKAFAYVPRKQTKCQSKENFKGIIGLDVFFIDSAVLQLDFTNKKICNIESKEISNIIGNGYNELKSECKAKKIYIFITVDGKEYKFKLDTGFSGSLVIPYSDKLDFTKYSKITIEGEMLRSIASTTNGEENFHEDVPVSFNNSNLNTIFQVSNTLKVQNMGMRFIRGFDWIIDYKNNKVYVKRNNNKIDAYLNKNAFKYIVSENFRKLVVSAKQKQLTKYNLGDEITSVNKQKITPENICEMQNLLNNSQDWNNIELEIIPAKK